MWWSSSNIGKKQKVHPGLQMGFCWGQKKNPVSAFKLNGWNFFFLAGYENRHGSGPCTVTVTLTMTVTVEAQPETAGKAVWDSD